MESQLCLDYLQKGKRNILNAVIFKQIEGKQIAFMFLQLRKPQKGLAPKPKNEFRLKEMPPTANRPEAELV